MINEVAVPITRNGIGLMIINKIPITQNTTDHTNATTPPLPTTTSTPTMYICICLFMPVAALAQVAQFPISISHMDTHLQWHQCCCKSLCFGKFPTTGRTRARGPSSSCKVSVELQVAARRPVRVQVHPRGSPRGRRLGEADLRIQDRSAQLVLRQNKIEIQENVLIMMK